MKIMRKFSLLLLLLAVISLYGCGAKPSNEAVLPDSEIQDVEASADESEADYPQIAYIENVTYYGNGEVCTMVPRKAPDGTIETFVPKEIMPDAHNSANFGQEQGQLEYMFLEDNQLIIHIGDDWYYFEPNQAEGAAEPVAEQ